MGRIATWGVVGAVAVGVRVVRARHRRILHPKGCSFVGELDVWGPAGERTGSDLVDHPRRYPVTVRISKGGGTPAGLPDVRGLAVRVHGPGTGRPAGPVVLHRGHRRGAAAPARSAVELRHVVRFRAGVPDRWPARPQGVPVGGSRPGWSAARPYPRVGRRGGRRWGENCWCSADGVPFGRLTFGAALPATADAALAFDPVRNTTADLHPTGLVHASRAWAYRAAQRWRGTRPAPPDKAAVLRAAAHR